MLVFFGLFVFFFWNFGQNKFFSLTRRWTLKIDSFSSNVPKGTPRKGKLAFFQKKTFHKSFALPGGFTILWSGHFTQNFFQKLLCKQGFWTCKNEIALKRLLFCVLIWLHGDWLCNLGSFFKTGKIKKFLALKTPNCSLECSKGMYDVSILHTKSVK